MPEFESPSGAIHWAEKVTRRSLGREGKESLVLVVDWTILCWKIKIFGLLLFNMVSLPIILV